MDARIEVGIKAILCIAAIAVVLRREQLADRLPDRRAGRLLLLVAALAAGSYFNFGAFHTPGFVHRWEMFHHFLGAKYFPELGYDGLYVASLAAEREAHPGRRQQRRLRDLRDNRVVDADELAAHVAVVRKRFSAERWEAFVADNRYFLSVTSRGRMASIRTDHGFNATPAWIAVARVLGAGWLTAGPVTLGALALLDPLLLVGLVACAWRVFGVRAASVLVILFGLGYLSRFYWVGGAFLRQDWLVALGLAVCCLRVGRPAAAGGLIAYATLVRVFPVLFLFGPVILWARAVWLKEDARPMRRLAVAFSAVLALGLGAGMLAGRGAAAWGQFASNLEKHEGAWLTNNVGLRNLALYGGETLRNERIDWSLPDPWQPWQETMEARYERRRPWIWAAAALLLALAAVAIWRQSGDQALIVSLVVPFALLALTCYYWVALALVALWRTRVPVVGLLIVNWALFLLHYRLAREVASGLSLAVVYGAASWGLVVLFVVWLLPEALRTVRRRSPTVLPEPPPQSTADGAS